MSRALLLAIGLGLALLGAATAFDVVSLRELAHSLNVPVLSGLVVGLREAMPTAMAHAIEPTVLLLGLLVTGWGLMRKPRTREAVLALGRHRALRAVVAFGILRAG